MGEQESWSTAKRIRITCLMYKFDEEEVQQSPQGAKKDCHERRIGWSTGPPDMSSKAGPLSTRDSSESSMQKQTLLQVRPLASTIRKPTNCQAVTQEGNAPCFQIPSAYKVRNTSRNLRIRLVLVIVFRSLVVLRYIVFALKLMSTYCYIEYPQVHWWV